METNVKTTAMGEMEINEKAMAMEETETNEKAMAMEEMVEKMATQTRMEMDKVPGDSKIRMVEAAQVIYLWR